MKLKNIAFTLAETLVVMGIIGVIAALTIPNLSQSTGNKERVTKIQKAYANLVEAIDRATAIYGSYENWEGSSSDQISWNNKAGDRITEFMKLSKNCRSDSTCTTSVSSNAYHFQLADGTFMNINAKNYGIDFDIDISKGKSDRVYGKTSFRGCYMFDGINPPYLAATRDTFNNIFSNVKYCIASEEELGPVEYSPDLNCREGSLAWIIKYGNMDYLKLNASGKCPNGTTPTESNPRCN